MEWEYYKCSADISEEELLRLGREGWELVTTIQTLNSRRPARNIESIPYHVTNTFIFKRPLDNASLP